MANYYPKFSIQIEDLTLAERVGVVEGLSRKWDDDLESERWDESLHLGPTGFAGLSREAVVENALEKAAKPPVVVEIERGFYVVSSILNS